MKMRSIAKVTIIGALFVIVLIIKLNAQELKDSDGNLYRTISYGVQVWTTSNLDVSHFRNGDPIPQAFTPEEWTDAGKTGQPAWCYYENNTENGNKYGKLYNWFAINDPRGLAPAGWHVPSNDDWRLLIRNLMGVDIAGTSLKSTTGWKSNPGSNKIGFTAIPGGYREADGKFRDLGMTCRWWSNSVPVEVKPSNQIFSLVLEDTSVEAKYLKSEKGSGFSVRCIKD